MPFVTHRTMSLPRMLGRFSLNRPACVCAAVQINIMISLASLAVFCLCLLPWFYGF